MAVTHFGEGRSDLEEMMAVNILMPKLGLNMKEGVIVEWLVRDGEKVNKGQPVVTVETEKVVNEVESEADGVLRHAAKEGDSVRVAEPFAYVLAEGEEMPEVSEQLEAEISLKAETTQSPALAVEAKGSVNRVLASPKVKKLAKKLGVNLESIPGTGSSGRITQEDVERAAAVGSPADENIIPVRGIRAAIARNMAKSSLETAQVTLMREADATVLVSLRGKINESRQHTEKISYNAMLVKLTAAALEEIPGMNAGYAQDTIRIKKDIHIGLAVDAEEGLLVPVVRNADCLSLEAINREINRLAVSISDKTYAQDDLIGNSFTITNLGAFGIEYFTPIINLPDMAVLGVGRIVDKPVAIDGEVQIRKQVFLSLTFDHRWVDGAPAARFLQRIAELIENPGSQISVG